METKNPPGWQAVWMQSAMHDVVDERARQVTEEGWTPQHDDQHATGTLAQAAACYAVHAAGWVPRGYGAAPYWPFDEEWWKPKGTRRDLVRAAALLIAEIERLDRATPPSGDSKHG